MAGWNGSGVFSKTYSWVADAANGIKILASRHDQNDTDFTSGINNCLTKDGQNAATADLPMGGNKHTNVSVATARNQYVTMGQYQDNSGKAYTTTGTANTYVLSPSPVITAYATGQSFEVFFNAGNTGSSTVNISTIGAVNLVKGSNTALASGDIDTGRAYKIIYTASGFQIQPTGTLAWQDANSVNIDGGAIDAVTLGTNSAVTEAQIDNINLNGNTISATSGSLVINNLLPTFIGQKYGLGLSNAADTDHDITVAVGICRDSADAVGMKLSSAMTKQIDATWSAGTNAGGLATSLSSPSTNTWYHVFLIVVSGSVDVGFDTDPDAANLIADNSATAYRWLGAVLTDGSSNIIQFTQTGMRFDWKTVPLSINTTITTTASLNVIAVPPDFKFEAILSINNDGGRQVYISDPDNTDQATSTTAAPLSSQDNATANRGVSQISVVTNTASQVRVVSSASCTVRVATIGFRVLEWI